MQRYDISLLHARFTCETEQRRGVEGLLEAGEVDKLKTKLLQEHLAQYGCTVINYSGDKITVHFFYSRDMYEKFLEGLDCRQGIGIYDSDQALDFNQIPDGRMVVVQEGGRHIETYKFVTIFKATMKFKENQENGKRVDRYITFSIRKNVFYSSGLNLVLNNRNIPFGDLQEIKRYLSDTYGKYTLTEDWSVYF